jgi:hypothetical protein
MATRPIVNISLFAMATTVLLFFAGVADFSEVGQANAKMSGYVSKRTGRSSGTSARSRGRSTRSSSRHRGRYHSTSRRRRHTVVRRVRYAYPVNFFLWKGPAFDQNMLANDLAQKVKYNFLAGNADGYLADTLVRAGVFSYYPLRGGIFWRREPVKYVVVHSTETGNIMDGKRVIDSWGGGGRRHAGAHFVVDRDGRIYQAVDPDLGAVHVNIFKTLPGINNDNSVGIEMVHTHSQTYTTEQRASVIRLVSFLQDHFQVADENVITHRYAQQGDHTDPVNFDWEGFLATKAEFRKQALAIKMTELAEEAKTWWSTDEPRTTVFLQPNGPLPLPTDKPQSVNIKPSKSYVEKKSNMVQEPALRGPIEMDPEDASLLNSPKTNGPSLSGVR